MLIHLLNLVKRIESISLAYVIRELAFSKNLVKRIESHTHGYDSVSLVVVESR